MRRRGFTLIEMLVVVALIAILGSLLVIGIGKLQTNSKRQQTRLIFQNLQAMFADYDTSRRVPFGAGNLNPAMIPALYPWLYLACPGDVTTGPDRTGIAIGSAQAVPLTRDFMAQMLTTTNNAAALGKLPSSNLTTFGGTYPYPTVSAWLAGTQYHVFDTATDSSGNPFVRTYLYTDPTGVTPGVVTDIPTNAPPNYIFWMPAIVANSATAVIPTPVPLDAWGNPVILVMGGVLGSGTALAANGTVVPGSGSLLAGGMTFQVHSPDYHPFFASAGPDGDFSKGDDNLYSFEK